MRAKIILSIHDGLKKIETPFFSIGGNWDYYTDGKSVYYIAIPGTGCDSGFFGDIDHLKKELCSRYLRHANKKGLFLSLSISDIFSIERYVGRYINQFIN